MAAGTPVSRIDMKHGFMKSIIKNQVDRDKYDKEVRATTTKGSSRTPRHSGSKHKKPEASVYIPPMRQHKDDGVKEAVFCVEFEDKDGEVYTFTVYKGDRAGHVARRIGQETQLLPPFVGALEERLQQELDKQVCQNDPVS